MCEALSGYKVAILAINGFNRRRFLEARARLVKAGADPSARKDGTGPVYPHRSSQAQA